MQTVIAKISGRSLSACCPFCVESGKAPDTKYHLRIEKGKYVYCFRCNFKKSYRWFIKNYSVVVEGGASHQATPSTAVSFEDYITVNTAEFNKSLCSASAYNYLIKRKLTPTLIKNMNIRLGREKLFGRVVFVDCDNKYFMGRSFLPSVKPKTYNPTGLIKPLMYAKPCSGGTLYLVEGVFDCVPFLKSGKRVCALLGKDISPHQMEMLRNIKMESIVIALDPDAYGSAIRLVRQIADSIPTISVGMLVYDHGVDGDPSDLDLDLFKISSILWYRVLGER